MLRILRWIFSIIKAVDKANIPLLRIVPSKTKRKLVRKIYKPLTATLPEVIELKGLLLHIPRDLAYSYVLHEHEPQTQQIIQKFVKPGMTVVDVGANIGYLTLLMAKIVGPAGKVYAVEPGRDNLEWLHKNIQLNGARNVKVLPVAAGAERQSRNFYLRKAGTLHSLHENDQAVVETLQVQVAPLDELVQEKPIDFVKIDVEGGEIEVLKGMSKILQFNPALRLIVEWNPSALKRAGHKAEELPDLLQKAGFHVSVIDEERNGLQSLEQAFKHLRADGQYGLSHLNLFVEKSQEPRKEFNMQLNCI
ncbi:FkbM family methyltransferase [bacterium]|nr:FkbM family methyltransferase [bacterium]